MGKKGKHPVRVEEHPEEDEGELGAIGYLWEDAAATANGYDERDHRGHGNYESWGVNPTDSASNANGDGNTGYSSRASHDDGATRRNSTWGATGHAVHPGHLPQGAYYSTHGGYPTNTGHSVQGAPVAYGAQLQRGGKNKRKKNEESWTNGDNTEWDGAGNNDRGVADYDYAGAGDGDGDGNDWGQPGQGGWGNETNATDWAGGTVGQDWGGGGETARNGRIPKVTVTSPSALGSRTVLSAGQHQQLLSALSNQPAKGSPLPPSSNAYLHVTPEQERGRGGGKKNKKNKKQQQEQYLESMPEESQGWEDEGKTNYWSSNLGSNWGGHAYSMPSKVFALAADGQGPLSGLGPRGSPYMETRFVDSHGQALASAQTALYSQERLARDRIHWLFSPHKDPRVSSLLEWIELMSYGLATNGLLQFLQSRERGALITNADYRPPQSPTEPAFDWITYDLVQSTMDRTLQESLAFYDPSTQVLVFVFLLSKTGNSMAIWRRKLTIPNNLRLAYGAQITQAIAGLQKQYPIHLDEVPHQPELPPVAQPGSAVKRRLTKRKWFKWLS